MRLATYDSIEPCPFCGCNEWHAWILVYDNEKVAWPATEDSIASEVEPNIDFKGPTAMFHRFDECANCGAVL